MKGFLVLQMKDFYSLGLFVVKAIYNPKLQTKNSKLFLRLRSWPAKIHGYFNVLKILDRAIGSFITFNIFFQRFHEAFGMHGSKYNS